MAQEIFDKFLSTGFLDANDGAREHSIDLYQRNYDSFLPRDKEAKILEIGCGLGFFLDFLARAGYKNYLGVDLSSEAVEYCQERGMSKVRLIEDLQVFLRSSENYDLVVLNDVIEHLEKATIIPIIKLIYEKLNYQGRIIIKTGNLESAIGARMRYLDFTHEVGFTAYSLAQVLKVARFRDILINPFSMPRNSFTRMIRYGLQKIWHGIWRGIFFVEYSMSPVLTEELIFAVAKK